MLALSKLPVSRETFAPVAQWIEYLASNQGVGGSIPSGRTKITKQIQSICGVYFCSARRESKDGAGIQDERSEYLSATNQQICVLDSGSGVLSE